MSKYTVISDMVITYEIIGKHTPAIVNAPFEHSHPAELPSIDNHTFYFNQKLIPMKDIPQKLWEWIQNECDNHFNTEASEYRVDHNDEITIDFDITNEKGCLFSFMGLNVTSLLTVSQLTEIHEQNKDMQNE